MTTVLTNSVDTPIATNKRKRNVSMDLLETAVFMSCRMGTTDKYDDIIQKIRKSRTRQKKHRLRKRRRVISNATVKYNTTLAKQTITFSTRLHRNVLCTREFYGAVPVTNKRDKISGYTRSRVICITPVPEHGNIHLTAVHFPMYYTMTDYERFNQLLYTRKFYNVRRTANKK